MKKFPILNIETYVYNVHGKVLIDPGIMVGAIIGSIVRNGGVCPNESDWGGGDYDAYDPFWQNTTPAEYIQKMNDIAMQLNNEIEEAMEKCSAALAKYHDDISQKNEKLNKKS